MSHLLQMRGLKQIRYGNFPIVQEESHLLQMRGLKQMILMIFMRNIWSHLLQMRGLKPFEPNTILTHFGRIFYRCVD